MVCFFNICSFEIVFETPQQILHGMSVSNLLRVSAKQLGNLIPNPFAGSV